MKKRKKLIILSGGGTGGSVSPLLGLYETLVKTQYRDEFEFLWLGGTSGPEKEMVLALNIPYKVIMNGKLRRYFSWKNFSDIARIAAGFFQSLDIIFFNRPDLIIAAGSFISVPLAWAGWVCRVPIIVHQQDVRPGLANLLMAPFARVVTKALDVQFANFDAKAVQTGNPLRAEILNSVFDQQKFKHIFGLKSNRPVLLFIGGGTGALVLNQLVENNIDKLLEKYQVIHIAGKNKSSVGILPRQGYYKYEFLDAKQLSAFYRIADVIITRCGLGTLSEIAYLGKPAILVPLPDSHQEDNAEFFYRQKAAIVLDQKDISSEGLFKALEIIIGNELKRNELSANIKKIMPANANGRFVEIMISLIRKSGS